MVKNDFRKTSISLEFLRKVFSFAEKHPQFYPKKCLFIASRFYLSEGELIHQVFLKKYIEHEVFDSTSHESKTKEEDQKYNPTS